MKKIVFFLSVLFIFSCKKEIKTTISPWVAYDETEELAKNATHEIGRMQYKLIQSKFLDKNEIWKMVADQIASFSEEEYEKLKPFILEQDIPTIQSHIQSGRLSYEKLTQWYLFRIVKFENDKDKTLHSIIALNPNAVEEARQRDKNIDKENHPIYGMPILLKDNINTSEMKTTAGAHALLENQTGDAFIAVSYTHLRAHETREDLV